MRWPRSFVRTPLVPVVTRGPGYALQAVPPLPRAEALGRVFRIIVVEAPSAVEVEPVDGIAWVGVGVGVASVDRVDRGEQARGRIVESDAPSG